MQVFENQEFGQLGVLMLDNKPYFPASDCAKIHSVQCAFSVSG
jgi:prophage antirepressor-like protein